MNAVFSIILLAVALGALGLIGCIIPVLPGTPVSWIGMLVLYLWGPHKATDPITTKTLLIWLAITILVAILTYVIPAKLTKATGGSKVAERGTFVGTIIGMFLGPWGIFIGAFLGALLAEMIFNGSAFWTSLKTATGSIIGFFCNTFMMAVASAWMLWIIIKHL